MAEFITKCPHCNNDLQVQDEWIGMDVDCPICSKTLTVRKPSEERVKNNSRTSSVNEYYCSNCKKEYSEPVKFCSECGSTIQNKSSNDATKAAQADNPDKSSPFYTCFWAIAILIGVPVLLTIWIDWPRTIFWCTLPLWGICLVGFASEGYKKLAILLFAGIIWWGGWVHTPTPEETGKTISSNTADSSSEKSHQTHESKIVASQKHRRDGVHFTFKWGYLLEDLDKTEFKSFTLTKESDFVFAYMLVTKNDYLYTIYVEKSSRKIILISSAHLATVKAFIKEVPDILESRNKVKDHEKASGYYLDCADDDVLLVCKNDENKKVLHIKESIDIDSWFKVVLNSL